MDLFTSLEQIALDKGFIVVNNQGEGNCMFHALSDQLKLVTRISVSHEQLRHAAVDYLESDEAAALVSCSFCYYLHVFPTLMYQQDNSLITVLPMMKTLFHFRRLCHCKVLLSHCLVFPIKNPHFCLGRGADPKCWFTIFTFPRIHIVYPPPPATPQILHNHFFYNYSVTTITGATQTKLTNWMTVTIHSQKVSC